ncbi:hypothetical protein AAF712_012122 [Marasmius tenuissimus]|uniref:Uncharacterized protein n=1 Tax=Marasmius tenuissimus TaxID=585030 RepID=A0ABR2ZI90_9AGAR
MSHVIVTLNASLADLVHRAHWIMVDMTFKVVHRETNTWKLIIWSDEFVKSVMIGRVWSNRATQVVFRYIWDGIFNSICNVTGQELNFKAFALSSLLVCALGDAEGAQAQGLGDIIISRRINIGPKSQYTGANPDILICYIWKTGLQKLHPKITDAEFEYLNTLPHISSQQEYTQFLNFCENTENTHIQSWWRHKRSYLWLIPSLSQFLLSINPNDFQNTPTNTNPTGGSHAQDNHFNGMNHSLLDTILIAAKYNAKVAQLFAQIATAGIHANPYNRQEQHFTQSIAQAENSQQKSLMTDDERKLRDKKKRIDGKLKEIRDLCVRSKSKSPKKDRVLRNNRGNPGLSTLALKGMACQSVSECIS